MSREPGVGVFSTRRCRVASPTGEAMNCGDTSLLLVLFRGFEVACLIAIGLLTFDACPVWYGHGFLLPLRRHSVVTAGRTRQRTLDVSSK